MSDSDVEDLMYLLDEIDFDMEIQGNDLVKGIDKPHVVIPEGVKFIRWDAFAECKRLTSVVFPSTLTIIGESAFRECNRLTSVTLPEGLTSIGDYAFAHCSRLTSVTLPEGLGSIGEGAFYECTRLEGVELPTSLTSIGESAFRDCTGLCVLVPPCRIGPIAFSDCFVVLNASGSYIHNSIVLNPRIIGLRKRLLVIWSANVRRQGRLRQTSRRYRAKNLGASQSFVELYSREELLEVGRIWNEILHVLGDDMDWSTFIFPKIFKEGRKLVRMKSYLKQPEETKVFKRVLEDLGIREPIAESGGEEKEMHVAKRMKRLHLRF